MLNLMNTAASCSICMVSIFITILNSLLVFLLGADPDKRVLSTRLLLLLHGRLVLVLAMPLIVETLFNGHRSA